MTDGYGIFNVRTNLGVHHTHEGGSGTTQVYTRADLEKQKNCPSSCFAKGSNPGSSDLNSDALPLSYVSCQVVFEEILMGTQLPEGWVQREPIPN